MGRTKSYSREEITGKAMDLFWLRGFSGTSTQDLVEHLGVNRYSLYAEFGSKQGVYEAALERYEHDVVTRHFALLETPDSGLEEVRETMRYFASSARRPGSERGCFLCNAATERAPHDPVSRGFVDAYLDRIVRALRRALTQAQMRGEVAAGVPVDDEARLLAATLLGFFVLLRAQSEPVILRGACSAAVRHIDALAA
jgi:TetR/AcrR family transcriptional regulator, transcriptional repressor for nem operon